VPISAGYLVDLRGVQFDDAASTTWIHSMTVGEYDHPLHGKISITPERIQRFADNINNRIRGIDLDIDYDHKAHDGSAAGWVQSAQTRPNGLWLLVKWTQTAYQKLKEGAYRYFSPEFHDEWKHPQSGQTFKDVLFGGAITNRPFLKDILPINMTEFINSASGGTTVDPAEALREIAKALGLPDASDPGIVVGFVQAKMGKPGGGGGGGGDGGGGDGGGGGGGGNPPGGGGPPGGGTSASETPPKKEDAPKDDPTKVNGTVLDEAAIMSLPFVKNLMETVTSQGKKLDEDAVNSTVIQLTERAAGKERLIPPVVKDGLKKQLAELPPASRPALIKLFEDMIDAGQVGVPAGEDGHAGHSTEKSAAKAFNDAISKKMTDSGGKMSFSDAAVLVAQENPNAYIEYQRELANS